MSPTFLQKFKTILSDRKVTVFILLAVIVSRIIQLCYFYNIVVDASYQVIGTQSLLNGHGVSIPNVVATNLSAPIYTPLINWPPGYSFLLAPFYALFKGDYIAAGITLDILSSITLIFVCRSILKILDISLYIRNLFTILTGFFIYYFYFNPCSDAIAITFFLLALYFALALIKSKKNQLLHTVLLTFFLFAVGTLKYLFIPAIFVIPVFLFFKALSDADKQLKKVALSSFLVIAVLLSTLLLYQKTVSGSATYISAGGRGFFPENLLSTYPAIPASFIQPNTIHVLSASNEKTSVLFKVYQVINIVLLLLTVIVFCKQFIKHRFSNLTVLQSLFYLTFLLSFAVIGLLIVLSLVVEKEQIFSWRLWTYVEDGRYYGLPNVLIHLSLFAFYKYYTSVYKKNLRNLFYLFLLLLVPEMLRGIYFDINRIKSYKKEEYSWQFEKRFQDYADSIIQSEKKIIPDAKVVITGTSYYFNHRIIINSQAAPLNELAAINEFPLLNSKTPVILLTILQKDSVANYQPFVSKKEVKQVGSFGDLNFFITTVVPH